MTIRAMLFTGPRQPLQEQQYARPTLAEGEALVRVRLCALCGSDLHTYFGRRTEPTPAILGHEIIGTIDELASPLFTIDGEPLQVGDRVTWSVAVSCGGCFFCERELPQKCQRLKKYGHVKEHLHGGLATHCHLLAGSAILKVPANLSDELAAPAMCATATAAAAVRAAEQVFRFPQPVALIVGAGLLGCTATAMLQQRGVRVIVCDVDEERLALARRFGATEAVRPEHLKTLLPAGADTSIELSGALTGVQCCWDHTRIGGTIVLVGTVSPTPSLEFYPEKVVRNCWTIRGVHNYAPQDLSVALRFLADHGSNYPFANLGPRYPLHQADAAFHHAEKHRPARVLIDCQE